jgi:hypothetical protein
MQMTEDSKLKFDKLDVILGKGTQRDDPKPSARLTKRGGQKTSRRNQAQVKNGKFMFFTKNIIKPIVGNGSSGGLFRQAPSKSLQQYRVDEYIDFQNAETTSSSIPNPSAFTLEPTLDNSDLQTQAPAERTKRKSITSTKQPEEHTQQAQSTPQAALSITQPKHSPNPKSKFQIPRLQTEKIETPFPLSHRPSHKLPTKSESNTNIPSIKRIQSAISNSPPSIPPLRIPSPSVSNPSNNACTRTHSALHVCHKEEAKNPFQKLTQIAQSAIRAQNKLQEQHNLRLKSAQSLKHSQSIKRIESNSNSNKNVNAVGNGRNGFGNNENDMITRNSNPVNPRRKLLNTDARHFSEGLNARVNGRSVKAKNGLSEEQSLRYHTNLKAFDILTQTQEELDHHDLSVTIQDMEFNQEPKKHNHFFDKSRNQVGVNNSRSAFTPSIFQNTINSLWKGKALLQNNHKN